MVFKDGEIHSYYHCKEVYFLYFLYFLYFEQMSFELHGFLETMKAFETIYSFY